MCGITGIVKFKGTVESEIVHKMNAILEHRGPDGAGSWLNDKKNVGLGHRRLSIIDLSSNAKQPMHFAENQLTITFNGEIYNYIELKKSLFQQDILLKPTQIQKFY
jgi:asparagine synthase (glutamine-hydrolysing)